MDELTEHAIEMSSGAMQVRPSYPDIERIYPLTQWIENNLANGHKVHRRRIVVVEDWTEVPRG